MTEEELNKFVKALHVWADSHPYQDEPSMTIGARSYTPRQLVEEVERRTPVGLMHLRVIDYAIQSKAENMDSILESLTRRY